LKQILLTSASVLALSLYPTSNLAQTVVQDKLRFDRYDARVDVAAAYTAVLLEANGHVRNFLNNTARAIFTGSRAGDPSAQQTYVLAIARSLEQTGQPPSVGGPYVLPTYPYAQMASFDVAHRYCGGQLVSFFDTNNFKSSLTAEQIQQAPRLQYIREGRQGSPATLFLLKTASDGSRYLLSATGQTQPYNSCMDSLNGAPAPLADDTLITFRRVAVPFEEASRRVVRAENERRACPAGKVGAGVRYRRETYQAYDAAQKRIGDPVLGEWVYQDQSCRDPKLIPRIMVQQCSNGAGVARYNYYLLEAQHPDNFGKIAMVPANKAGEQIAALQFYYDWGICDDDLPATVTIGPISDVSTEETRARACNAVYPSWNNRLEGNYFEARTRRERKFEFADQYSVDDIHQVSYTPWVAFEDSCKMITTSQFDEYRDLGCLTGFQGEHRQKRTLRTVTTNFVNPATQDTQVTSVYSGWESVTFTCELIPAPPLTKIYCGLADGDKAIYAYPGQCPGIFGYTGGTMGNTGGSSGGSGGGGGGGGAGSVDVNNDGIGDYRSGDSRGIGGTPVDGGCGGCNGPSGGGSDGAETGAKIICTAMNAAYGFGSYRQAIWLAHAAKNMSVYHQTGYHLLALPLIRKAYGSDSKSARIVRKSIEHIVRERTADIRAEMRGSQRRPLGRFYRATLEPLCYALGWMAKGRSVEEIKEVPVIAAALRTATQNTKGQIHV